MMQKLITILFTTVYSLSLIAQQKIDTLKNYTGEEFLFVSKRIYSNEAVTLTNTEFKKLAASFDDPTRLLMKYPGFSNDNDQANGIIYHGLPTHFNSWQVNGLEIVNPNHLSNAGTFSDLTNLAAGGVNMFSGNVIDKFSFYTPFDKNKRSGALGGVANMVIDNNQRSFAQVSLLGLESGIKIDKGKHHFFGNLRYSFTGLLADFGVDFGGEAIRFADGVLGYKYIGSTGTTNVLFAKGKSRNFHKKQAEILTVKDALEIDYKSDINIAQVIHNENFSNGASLSLGASISYKDDSKFVVGTYPNSDDASSFFYLKQGLFTAHQSFTNAGGTTFGMKQIQIGNKLNQVPFNNLSLLPYVEKKYTINQFWTIDAKLEAFYHSRININPFLKITFLKNNTIVALIANRSAQAVLFNEDIQDISATNLGLNFKKQWKKSTAQVNLFYHNINNIASSNNYYSNYNAYDYDQVFTSNNALALSRGIDFLYEFNLNKNFWMATNYTIFRSLQKQDKATLKWENTENNFNHIGNVNIGKDFLIGSKKLSISSSYHYRGGQYVFDIFNSYYNKKDYSKPPTTKLNPYTRLDFRLNYSGAKYMVSMDLQNILGKENDAYIGYDVDGPQVRKQLGLLPVLSYKRFF